MRKLRLVLWIFVALFAGVAGFSWLNTSNKPSIVELDEVKIGGPFELVDHRGDEITDAALAGRNYAVFFGFTHCPDFCPTTLLEAAGWLKTLGDDGEEIDFYFVSADPERDTPEVLSDYVNAFHPRITGITGELEDVQSMIKSYRAYAKKVPLEDGDYTIDHSVSVMLFNSKGDFKGTISYGENTETAIAKLRRLIKNS